MTLWQMLDARDAFLLSVVMFALVGILGRCIWKLFERRDL